MPSKGYKNTLEEQQGIRGAFPAITGSNTVVTESNLLASALTTAVVGVPDAPAGPLSAVHANAIEVAFVAKTSAGVAMAIHQSVKFWFSDDATFALTASGPDVATIANVAAADGVIISSDNDKFSYAVTDASGALTLDVQHDAAADNWYMFFDCGGRVDSVNLDFT